MFQKLNNERAKGILNDVENLTEEKLNEVDEYLNDFKKELLEAKGRPTPMSAYILSKASTNAYTKISTITVAYYLLKMVLKFLLSYPCFPRVVLLAVSLIEMVSPL